MKEKIRLAYVGVGARGISVLTNCLLHMTDVEISVICDLDPVKCEAAVKAVAILIPETKVIERL